MNEYRIMRMLRRKNNIFFDLYDDVTKCCIELTIHYGGFNVKFFKDIISELELRFKINSKVTVDYIVNAFEKRINTLNSISDDDLKNMILGW